MPGRPEPASERHVEEVRPLIKSLGACSAFANSQLVLEDYSIKLEFEFSGIIKLS